MAEIKYQYAYDEYGKLVSINDYTKEESKLHSYKCVGCGKELLPRAIGSKSRKAHFYHKELVDCDGETYVHKLGKMLIKRKFDESESFMVAYTVSKECNKEGCRLRNLLCHEDRVVETINLKEYYDTCSVETAIGGFVADLLLTNSQKTRIPPILIEICVTHPCEEEKLNSGLKIIELKFKKEQDVLALFSQPVIGELVWPPVAKQNVKFISFNRELKVPMETEVSRYVFNPLVKENGYVAKISCKKAALKLKKDSLVELNFVNITSYWDDGIWVPLFWMNKYKYLRRCTICKFYYCSMYEDTPICRLSKKYGKPKYPEMVYAEHCESFHSTDVRGGDILTQYYVEEVTAGPDDQRDEYRVIVAGCSSFNDYNLFKEKCDYYLSEKMKTHHVTILCGTARGTSNFIQEYSKEHSIDVEPYEADWDRYGYEAGGVSNDEMIKYADALIAFWNGRSKIIGALIESAKEKGIKVAVVRY